MIPWHLKEGDGVYFIPYTTDTPQIKLGYITKDFKGHRFIAYDYKWADDGQWYICEKKDIGKSEIQIKIFNLLQKIKAENEDNQ